MWIPLLGWSAAKFAYDRRVQPFVKEIQCQLERRPCFPANAWGEDESRVAFARRISKVIAEEIGWPNDHFHPDDPVSLALWSYRDGLDIDFLLMELEHESGCKITNADCTGMNDMTLGQVVDFLLAKSTASGS